MLKRIYKLGELTLMKNVKEQIRKEHDLLDLFWDKGLERSIYDKLVTEVVIKKWIIMMVK